MTINKLLKIVKSYVGSQHMRIKPNLSYFDKSFYVVFCKDTSINRQKLTLCLINLLR